MKIKNTFWFRHFLLCNEFAKKCCDLRGWDCPNFALLILEEQNGRIFNKQMTCYFWTADELFSQFHQSDATVCFDYLKVEDGVSMEELSKLTADELYEYAEEYCYETFSI